MAKTGMDDEALAIQRAARELEKLDDPSAQARVALYLYLRYTAAGDRIAPGGEIPSTPTRWIADGPPTVLSAHSTAQQPVSGAPVVSTGNAPPASPRPAAGQAAGRSPGTPAVAPGAQSGLDLSGKGTENDDDGSDDEDELVVEEPYVEPTFEGDDDGVEVEI